jgi:hypothetical protein
MADYQTSVAALNPCDGPVAWLAAYPTPDAAWAACTNGTWMLWFMLRQAPDLAERKRVAGSLVPLITPYITSANIADGPTLTALQALLAAITSYSTGGTTFRQLILSAGTIALPELSQSPTGPQMLQQELGSAVIALGRACAEQKDPDAAAQWASHFCDNVYGALIRLGQAADLPAAKALLATMIRANLTFAYHLPS